MSKEQTPMPDLINKTPMHEKIWGLTLISGTSKGTVDNPNLRKIYEQIDIHIHEHYLPKSEVRELVKEAFLVGKFDKEVKADKYLESIGL